MEYLKDVKEILTVSQWGCTGCDETIGVLRALDFLNNSQFSLSDFKILEQLVAEDLTPTENFDSQLECAAVIAHAVIMDRISNFGWDIPNESEFYIFS